VTTGYFAADFARQWLGERMRLSLRVLPLVLAVAAGVSCTESRKEKLEREAAYANAGKKVDEAGNPIPEVPPDPTREALRPLLAEIYSNKERLPDVLEADITVEDGANYQLTAGVMSTIRVKKGLSKEDKIKAIVQGTAEADSWTFRKNARRDYGGLIEKIKYSYGDETKNKILRAYADLKLIAFLNSPDAAKAIGQLPAEVKGTVEAMKTDYSEGRDKYWQKWMGVKMYARRTVGGDEPFRSVLRQISRDLGQEELPPRSFAESVDPPFKPWAAAIEADEKLLILLTNMKELKDRVEFLGETHTIWAQEGSALIPEKAKSVVIDKETGYGFFREDLGGGYNDLTFVFSKKLAGDALKRAFIHSLLFRQLLTDYQMLATAGGDFAKKNEGGTVDPNTSIVPDKYDPLYARCGGTAALDTMLVGYGATFPLLAGMASKQKDSEKALTVAHKCIIEGAKGDIRIPEKDDEFDTEGPAPASRLAIYQMLARFEKFDVDTAALSGDKRMAEDDTIEEQEKLLKQLKAQAEAQKKEE
jgi:hypothetical protein